MKVLTVADLRIYIDEAGAALFDPTNETRAVVETKRRQYTDFIEAWLEASEENRPRRVTEEELELRTDLTVLAKKRSVLASKDQRSRARCEPESRSLAKELRG